MEDRTEYSRKQDISFTYNVLGGIANRSPFRPDAELLGDAAFAFTALKVFSSLTCASESLFSKAETFYPQNY